MNVKDSPLGPPGGHHAEVEQGPGWLKCPGCGDIYTHPVRVRTYEGHYGLDVRIEMSCEQGCEFDLWVQSWKGNAHLLARDPRPAWDLGPDWDAQLAAWNEEQDREAGVA